MSSIATAVFKATIGLLVNKGRDKAAEKLKDGDITDQKFRGLIVREIGDIKSKLDGLSRKDLLASISFFEEGIELLYEVFNKARSTTEHGAATTQAACDEAFSLVKAMRKLDLTDLDESATRALSDAKGRFKDARREATRAFANKALETADRILAMQYRVMATILEKLDNSEDAVAPCRKCIEELHRLSAVQECFNVELTKGLRARFGKDERRKVIADVSHVNFVIYSTTLIVCFGNKELSNWPCVGSGEDKVHPLRDERVAKVLRKQGVEHCCVPRSFGQEGEDEHKLKNPRGIATNSSGHIIVGEYENEVKIFDPSGQFLQRFSVPNDDVETKLYILDVATDNQDNIYVLVRYEKKTGSTVTEGLVVYEFSNTAGLHHKFPVRGEDWDSRLTVTNSQVLVLSRYSMAVCGTYVHDSSVDVYDTDGEFVRSFGEGTLKDARDITAANDGRVMVVERDDSYVHIFSEDGFHLKEFKLQGRYWYPRIAFHRGSEHVVITGMEEDLSVPGLLHVEIFTKDGDFVRSTQIHEKRIDVIRGVTATMDGRIAVLLLDTDDKHKVVVL
ncbi:uncharacterized protein LOC110040177 [Orbicella faveolata]|uniref:uncharacterized protein LOC110040177 n=1 Tax=Orbicella faveolata TaxID=48498 RepID=UPI0009E56647|nr:uncharacterized protein LOC110040177 [Orbicella faveolata]